MTVQIPAETFEIRFQRYALIAERRTGAEVCNALIIGIANSAFNAVNPLLDGIFPIGINNIHRGEADYRSTSALALYHFAAERKLAAQQLVCARDVARVKAGLDKRRADLIAP